MTFSDLSKEIYLENIAYYFQDPRVLGVGIFFVIIFHFEENQMSVDYSSKYIEI